MQAGNVTGHGVWQLGDVTRAWMMGKYLQEVVFFGGAKRYE